jgi:hypothetical protein
MMRKGLLLLAMGSAVGVPYVSSEWSNIKAKFAGGNTAGTPSHASPNGAGKSPSAASFGAPSQTGYVGSAASIQHPLAVDPQREETPLVDMKDSLRFNVTPDWVIMRWPRVTSGLPHENLHGMRVTLITGVMPDDLAGALTYYFTPRPG